MTHLDRRAAQTRGIDPASFAVLAQEGRRQRALAVRAFLSALAARLSPAAVMRPRRPAPACGCAA